MGGAIVTFAYTLEHLERPLHERVIERFADVHEYNITEYNCVNYSEDLGFILDNLGYNTHQIRNIKTENGTHRRLALEIEPEDGVFVLN